MNSHKLGETLENAILPLIQYKGADQNQEPPARILLWFLKRFSGLYGAVVQLRLWLFEKGILHRYPLGCQVISVGNITAGGTGKTPMVEYLARSLQERGRKVAILSRGYRKKEKGLGSNKPTIVSVGDGPRKGITSEICGDEPYMLARNLRNVVVIVHKNRVLSGRKAVRDYQCDTLILDDGFQYQRLKHRQDLVLVDCGNPFGNENVLPRGILREPLRNLGRASFICITKVHGRDTSDLRRRIGEFNPGAGIMECNHVPRLLRNAFTDAELPLSALKDAKVFSMAGIASPRSFDDSLENLGATILERRHFADHHRFSRREISSILRRAASLGASMVVTTEKDAVRIPPIENCPVPIYYLRIEIDFTHGLDKFEECLGLITKVRPQKTQTP